MSGSTPVAPARAESGGRRLDSPAVGKGEAARAPKTARLKWIDIFETGNADIDALHRKLFEDCDRLMTLVSERAPWALVVGAAKELIAECIAHFRVEESLLECTSFPRREVHLATHRRMEQQMRGLVARMERVNGSLREHRDLPASLGPAIMDLMIRHDLDYCSHLRYLQGR